MGEIKTLYDPVEMGLRLHDLRQAKAWTLRDLAAKCDLSVAFLCDLEQGRREAGLRTALRLARLYGKSVEWLATGEGGHDRPAA